MKLGIRHEVRHDYEDGAAGLAMRLRLWPSACQGLEVMRWQVSVDDEVLEPGSVNVLGDPELIWRSPGRIESVIIRAEGDVSVTDCAGMLGGMTSPVNPLYFLRQTSLTSADEALIALAESVRGEDGELAMAHRLSDAIHTRIAYRSGSTGMETSAAQAFGLGAGVCQDMSHIFISAARRLGIPARYVTGYVHDPQLPQADHEATQ